MERYATKASNLIHEVNNCNFWAHDKQIRGFSQMVLCLMQEHILYFLLACTLVTPDTCMATVLLSLMVGFLWLGSLWSDHFRIFLFSFWVNHRVEYGLYTKKTKLGFEHLNQSHNRPSSIWVVAGWVGPVHHTIPTFGFIKTNRICQGEYKSLCVINSYPRGTRIKDNRRFNFMNELDDIQQYLFSHIFFRYSGS